MSTTAVAPRPVRSSARPVSRPRPAARPAAPLFRTARPAVRRRRPNVLLRRRIAAALTVVALILALGVTWAMRSEAAPEGVIEATVVVAPGETVWDIANQYVPDGTHPQAYVAHVLRYNDLEAGSVLPGTVLRLPRP